MRAAKAETIKKCRKLYQALLLDHVNLAANHNTGVYRLYKPIDSSTTEGYTDDGEFGMGRVVKKCLHELDAKKCVCVCDTSLWGRTHRTKEIHLCQRSRENSDGRA